MEFFSGPDVSVDKTAICVVDDKGAVHLQSSVPTDAEAIMQALKPFLPRLRRVGHEAGSLSPWLHPELKALGIPALSFMTAIDVQGRFSKAGDPDVRRALYEAASAMLTRFKDKDKVKTWGLHAGEAKLPS
jgi:transposase